jgi:integrase
VRQLLERFRDEVVSATKSAEVDTYIINAFLRHPLAQSRLSEATPGKFAQYRDERLKTVSTDTVQRELSVYQRAFKKAMVDWDVPLQANPLAQIAKPKKANGRKRRMLHDEQQRVNAAITQGTRRCRNPYIQSLFVLAVETSCRRSELLRLEWDKIDLQHRTAYLPDNKNGEDREIGLSSKAVETLKALRERNDRHPTKVFPLSGNAVKCAWRRLRKRAGSADLRFHDLRHEAISRFFEEKGLSVPEVALMSGHKDYRMLARYTHMRARQVAAKLG